MSGGTATSALRIARGVPRRILGACRRWRATHLPPRAQSGAPAGAMCQWLSTDPPILLSGHWLDESYRTIYSLEPVFRQLRGRTAHFFYIWYWHIQEKERVRTVQRMEQAHRRRFPGHRFVHLCNSREQLEAFLDAGLAALLCNHNCLLDETIYRPEPGVAKRFDAVYNARFKRYKRHGLAARVESLALIYALQPAVDDPDEVAAIRRAMAHAHFFNHDEEGGYVALDAAEVRRCLNECRVGLCLSAVEGGMYASMEYLLCGLPVVSTKSQGGRDVFFDAVNARIVDATPEAVRAGIEAVLARGIPPEVIRQSVMTRIREHRASLQAAVQAVYDAESVPRRFVDEWPDLFYDRLHRFQTHEAILRQLAGAPPGAGEHAV